MEILIKINPVKLTSKQAEILLRFDRGRKKSYDFNLQYYSMTTLIKKGLVTDGGVDEFGTYYSLTVFGKLVRNKLLIQ